MPRKETERYSRIKWETIRKLYGPKMIQAMHNLYIDLERELPDVKPSEEWEMDADNYWVVITCKPDDRESFDISFEIAESQDYEGVEGGYTFRIGIVEDGGRILGECSPFNYTEQVWCKTMPTIKKRFEMVRDALGTIPNFCREILEGVHD